MKKELIIRSNSNAVDFAMLNEGRLIELDKEVGKNKFSVGDIFVAKIRKTIPGLNAAFVNVGHEKDGFLHYHDLGPKLLSLSKFVDQIESKKIKSFSFTDRLILLRYFLLFILILPFFGFNKPNNILTKVVLPDPDGPNIVMNSPSAMSN